MDLNISELAATLPPALAQRWITRSWASSWCSSSIFLLSPSHSPRGCVKWHPPEAMAYRDYQMAIFPRPKCIVSSKVTHVHVTLDDGHSLVRFGFHHPQFIDLWEEHRSVGWFYSSTAGYHCYITTAPYPAPTDTSFTSTTPSTAKRLADNEAMGMNFLDTCLSFNRGCSPEVVQIRQGSCGSNCKRHT